MGYGIVFFVIIFLIIIHCHLARLYCNIIYYLVDTIIIGILYILGTIGSWDLFSFEKWFIIFTVEVETTDGIESKTFEQHLSPHKNPPTSFWIYIWA